jgi:hypothetical protein
VVAASGAAKAAWLTAKAATMNKRFIKTPIKIVFINMRTAVK